MKKTSKILITILLVVSMLTAFCIVAFATGEDITTNGVTYTYNNNTLTSKYLYIKYLDNKEYYHLYGASSGNDVFGTIDSNYNIVEFFVNPEDTSKVYAHYYLDSNHVGNKYLNYTDINDYFVYEKPIEIKYSTNRLGDGITINYNNGTSYTTLPELNEYMYFQFTGYTKYLPICNNNNPSIYDKIDNFITYLQTSLTQITTLIIGSQVLMLFIVAIPIVSFVVGAFKRFKDAGRL